MTIGVISDTHIYPHGSRQLPGEVIDLFRRFRVGLILHAGDVSAPHVLVELAEVAPVLGVGGNNDQALQNILPLSVRFTVGRCSFLLIHGHGGESARKTARSLAGKVDCVVYGHSHIPMIELTSETILFNPGSATDRRWHDHFGVGLIEVEDDLIKPELVLFRNPQELRNVKPDRITTEP